MAPTDDLNSKKKNNKKKNMDTDNLIGLTDNGVLICKLESCDLFNALTSAAVLLTDPSVLTGVAVARSHPAAAPVHPKHPPAPRPSPLCRVAHSDWFPVELQALQAANEISWMMVDLRNRVPS